MAIPFESPTAKDQRESSMPSFCNSEAEGVSSRAVFDATDPADHGTVTAAEPLRFRVIWSPRFATVEHSQVNAGLVHIAAYPPK